MTRERLKGVNFGGGKNALRQKRPGSDIGADIVDHADVASPEQFEKLERVDMPQGQSGGSRSVQPGQPPPAMRFGREPFAQQAWVKKKRPSHAAAVIPNLCVIRIRLRGI